MKKQGYAILMAFILVFALTGCGNKSLLSAKEPVELTMWHVYGEQAGSPMDTLVEEFNRTEGKEKGVRVRVTELSSAAKIGGFLLETQRDSAQEMPDLFTCLIGDAIALGEDNLLDWNDYFTEKEQSEFVSGFLADGEADGKLLVFPLSKSTQLLMLNGTGIDPHTVKVEQTVLQYRFKGAVYAKHILCRQDNIRRERTKAFHVQQFQIHKRILKAS